MSKTRYFRKTHSDGLDSVYEYRSDGSVWFVSVGEDFRSLDYETLGDLLDDPDVEEC